MSDFRQCNIASPPWEVLVLVSQHLDPKTIAISSCVCKTWSISMSSDHLWRPICFTHFPSLSTTLHRVDPTVSYRRLYYLAHISHRRRQRTPMTPRISLDNLIFIIDVFDNNYRILALSRYGNEIECDRNGVFRFNINVGVGVGGDGLSAVEMRLRKEVKVTWTIVLEGWRGMFSLMDCKGVGRLVTGGDRWFSEELPLPGCCSNAGMSGLVAELGLGFGGGKSGDGEEKKGRRVEKVSVGMLSVVSWRYASVEDGLRYLEHFLLPSQ